LTESKFLGKLPFKAQVITKEFAMKQLSSQPSMKPNLAKGRSRAYPTISLESVIDFIGKIREQRNYTEFTRQEFAVSQGLKQPSGAMNSSFSAAVQYGLLDSQRDKTRLTDLARRILDPEDDDTKYVALMEAFATPDLHREILEKYAGQKLPKALGNVLLASFGIHAKVKESCANLFLKSAHYAKMFDADGTLITHMSNHDDGTYENEDLTNQPPQTRSAGQPHPTRQSISTAPGQHHDIVLPGGRKAVLILPEDLHTQDMKVLNAFVTYLTTQVEIAGFTDKDSDKPGTSE
jgi:hypothetical protein